MFEMMEYIEHVITIVLGLCVFLAARNNVWNWPIGLVGVTMYGLSAWFLWGLYADAVLQIFYFATGIFGWVWWLRGGKNRTEAPVTNLSGKEQVVTWLGIAVTSTVLGHYLATTTDSVVPYLDAFTTMTCLIAQVLLMMRNRFNWVLWMVADVFYVYMFYVKGLNLLAIEYALFTLNAGYGYYVWTKELKND